MIWPAGAVDSPPADGVHRSGLAPAWRQPLCASPHYRPLTRWANSAILVRVLTYDPASRQAGIVVVRVSTYNARSHLVSASLCFPARFPSRRKGQAVNPETTPGTVALQSPTSTRGASLRIGQPLLSASTLPVASHFGDRAGAVTRGGIPRAQAQVRALRLEGGRV
jgi:hypothetical protein